MKNRTFFLFLLLAFSLFLWKCAPENQDTRQETGFQILESYQQVHILAGEKHFATYLYDTALKKPVLWPVYSPSGIRVQRKYPLETVEGENHDHPHHVGVFFTYGSDEEVNGNSFWAAQQGATRIKHTEITRLEASPGQATLGVRAHWTGKDGEPVLEEDRIMVFTAKDSERAIDFTFNMEALDEEVVFKDTKEGMFAIRVANWLTETDGNAMYLNSGGDTTEANVWGKRAEWMRLEGTYEGKEVGIIIMNHPSSVNFPTFWHARGYGLFAANPLGQSVFQGTRGEEDPEPLNYTIPAGERALFRFKLIIYEGHRTAEEIQAWFEEYSS